ncbi:hypothetical protein Bca52824_035349 [Brassica carinata]|uniref:Uncharacterized protein n=1 Tax=Brassica carinata TaxID=52824 RepID=A0A8X7V1P7_BRACI|nr:hypothetical protein Bca52824_035349 [Brassica carinata]
MEITPCILLKEEGAVIQTRSHVKQEEIKAWVFSLAKDLKTWPPHPRPKYLLIEFEQDDPRGVEELEKFEDDPFLKRAMETSLHDHLILWSTLVKVKACSWFKLIEAQEEAIDTKPNKVKKLLARSVVCKGMHLMNVKDLQSFVSEPVLDRDKAMGLVMFFIKPGLSFGFHGRLIYKLDGLYNLEESIKSAQDDLDEPEAREKSHGSIRSCSRPVTINYGDHTLHPFEGGGGDVIQTSSHGKQEDIKALLFSLAKDLKTWPHHPRPKYLLIEFDQDDPRGVEELGKFEDDPLLKESYGDFFTRPHDLTEYFSQFDLHTIY